MSELNLLSRDTMDPFLAAMLDAKPLRVSRGEYLPLSDQQIGAALGRLLSSQGIAHGRVERLRRMAGGASKEQFAFALVDEANGHSRDLVLRMDPVDGVLETSRRREVEVLSVMRGVVPVPDVVFQDLDGDVLGAPGIVVSLVPGVTKPAEAASGVSGLGTGFNEHWRKILAPPFVDNLARIHSVDPADPRLASFGRPTDDPHDSALWQVNHWARVWRDDAVAGCATVALVEQWLRENLPECPEPVVVHGDYRTGNYLFDPDSGEVTAILDWELAHIGDFHQDLALSLVELFGTQAADGTPLCSSLMTRAELIERYEAASGRTVNARTLAFYHVLSAWSLLIMGGATGLRAAKAKHNHQDILLTWLSMVAHPLADELTRLLSKETFW